MVEPEPEVTHVFIRVKFLTEGPALWLSQLMTLGQPLNLPEPQISHICTRYFQWDCGTHPALPTAQPPLGAER